ncbi:hypothetical protein [Paenibacillus koleovorans]|uniref:hypothetical protein n=1 Tax=Paenibacillus koleovorans TaxID=121608 RepID=UPI001FE79262|nr:hypothetical protein [Paenibacillus koleovorans]
MERRVFNDAAIPYLVKQLNEYQQSISAARNEEIKALSVRLADTDRQINNIVGAVSQGFTQASFLDKLTELEADKARLEVRIAERRLDESKPTITEDVLRQLFAEFKEFVATRNVPEIKKFIGSYVDKVIIYDEHVEVIFKLDAAGISLDGTEIDAFAATVAKKDLFGMKQDAV